MIDMVDTVHSALTRACICSLSVQTFVCCSATASHCRRRRLYSRRGEWRRRFRVAFLVHDSTASAAEAAVDRDARIYNTEQEANAG